MSPNEFVPQEEIDVSTAFRFAGMPINQATQDKIVVVIEHQAERLQRLLDLLSYKPGWEFAWEVYRIREYWDREDRMVCVYSYSLDSSGFRLMVRFKVPNADDGGATKATIVSDIIVSWERFEKMSDMDFVMDTVSELIRHAEEHEFLHWLKFDRIPVRDAHPEITHPAAQLVEPAFP